MEFPQQFSDLMTWLKDESPVKAVPSIETMPEVWMLGSSDFGAMMAANEGLPYAFAQHFSHLPALEVIGLYRENFRPSAGTLKPKAMLGTHIICADTDEEAYDLAMSSDLSFSLFVQTGRSIPLPTVKEAKAYPYNEHDWQNVRASSMPKFIGSPATIRKALKPFVESGIVDELMILTMVHDQVARMKSYKLIAELDLFQK
ncbi:MAG TPA: LLM class flavin-dependent oxidoreductase [Bacteriovoracaceae bacterium]|nr:LLM class flavin-dependent oxidoreductase [Bacteriovoracaceae bacterium]